MPRGGNANSLFACRREDLETIGMTDVRRTSNVFIILTVVLALLTLIGCGAAEISTSVPPSPTSAATVPPPTAVPATAAPVAAASTPVATAVPTRPAATATQPPKATGPVGNLRVALTSFGNGGFYVSITPRATFMDAFADFSFYREPVTGRFDGGYVERWELSEDGLTWKYHMRKGIKFHDGSVAGPQDMLFSQLIRLRQGATKVPQWVKFVKDPQKPESVIALEPDGTLKITTPTPLLTWVFEDEWLQHSELLSKTAFETAEAKGGIDEWNRRPVLSGPFKVTESKKDELVNGEAFLDYWRGRPYLARVSFVNVPEARTVRALLEAGQADAIEAPIVDAPEIQKKGFKTYVAPGAISTFFFFENMCSKVLEPTCWDASLPWLGDYTDPTNWENAKKVRKAFNLAVDRDLIMDKVYKGLAIKASFPFVSAPAVDDHPFFKRGPYPYDLDQAKRLLKEGGYPSGRVLKIGSTVLSGAPEMPLLAETFAAMMEANLGLKTEIVPFESRDRSAMQTKSEKRPWDIYVNRNSNNLVAGGRLHWIMDPLQKGRPQNNWPAATYEGVKKVQGMQPSDERSRASAKLYEEWYDDYAVIPIAITPVIYATSQKVMGWPLVPLNPWMNNFREIRMEP